MANVDPPDPHFSDPEWKHWIQQHARRRWFENDVICKIIRNHESLTLSSEKPSRPAAGSWFLFDRARIPDFRDDGYHWKKKPSPSKQYLQANGTDLVLEHVQRFDNLNFERRIYWIKNSDKIVFLHYKENREDPDQLVSQNVEEPDQVAGGTKDRENISKKLKEKIASKKEDRLSLYKPYGKEQRKRREKVANLHKDLGTSAAFSHMNFGAKPHQQQIYSLADAVPSSLNSEELMEKIDSKRKEYVANVFNDQDNAEESSSKGFGSCQGGTEASIVETDDETVTFSAGRFENLEKLNSEELMEKIDSKRQEYVANVSDDQDNAEESSSKGIGGTEASLQETDVETVTFLAGRFENLVEKIDLKRQEYLANLLNDEDNEDSISRKDFGSWQWVGPEASLTLKEYLEEAAEDCYNSQSETTLPQEKGTTPSAPKALDALKEYSEEAAEDSSKSETTLPQDKGTTPSAPKAPNALKKSLKEAAEDGSKSETTLPQEKGTTPSSPKAPDASTPTDPPKEPPRPKGPSPGLPPQPPRMTSSSFPLTSSLIFWSSTSPSSSTSTAPSSTSTTTATLPSSSTSTTTATTPSSSTSTTTATSPSSSTSTAPSTSTSIIFWNETTSESTASLIFWTCTSSPPAPISAVPATALPEEDLPNEGA